MPRPCCKGKMHNDPLAHGISPLGIIIALVFLLFAFPLLTRVGAQFLTEKPLVPLPESSLWVEGKTSVSSYECHARDIDGFGFIADTSFHERSSKSRAVVKVRVPVRELDCGKPGMNRDMYQALKSEEHPYIHYELKDINRETTPFNFSGTGEENWLQIKTKGELTIAGRTRNVDLQVSGKRIEGQKIRVKGKKSLNMRSYGVDPPTALFGLVRAKDSLSVHFDLITSPTDSISREALRDRLE